MILPVLELALIVVAVSPGNLALAMEDVGDELALID